jgi:hypothetical protein
LGRSLHGLILYLERGRKGRVNGARGLVNPASPSVNAYRIGSGQIEILTIMHGAFR